MLARRPSSARPTDANEAASPHRVDVALWSSAPYPRPANVGWPKQSHWVGTRRSTPVTSRSSAQPALGGPNELTPSGVGTPKDRSPTRGSVPERVIRSPLPRNGLTRCTCTTAS